MIKLKKLLNAFVYRINRLMSTKLYLLIRYYLIFGKSIDWDNPKGFNEKLNWMKLNYRNPLFTMMADKYWVKSYVERLIGVEYIVPCYGCWKNVDDIDFDKLPDRIFLKSNHDSGGGILLQSPSYFKRNKTACVGLFEIEYSFRLSSKSHKNM